MLLSELTIHEPAQGRKQPATANDGDDNKKRPVSDGEITDALQPNEERPSERVLDEFTDAEQQVVRNALIPTMFVFNLCVMPLVYMIQTFAIPSEWLLIRAHHFLYNPFPRACYHQGVQYATTRLSSPKLISYLMHFITLPFRMIQTLYQLCSVLEDDPDILSRVRAWDQWEIERIELQTLQRNHLMQDSENPSITDQPAIASQVYHAALTDDGKLDEILDAFEPGHSNHGSLAEAEPSNETESLAVPHRHHASLSIQATPVEMIRSKESVLQIPNTRLVRLHSEGFASFEMDAQQEIGRADSPTPIVPKRPYKGWSSPDSVDEQRHMSLPEPCTAGHCIEGSLGDMDDLKYCATYAKRQRLSMLPRRLGTRSETHLQLSAAKCKETLSSTPNAPAKKRNKLQKRVKRV